ncbi:MAG: AAA family ATPase [Sumerlaeia bacterium]
MISTPKIIIISRDVSLRQEVDNALSAIADIRAIVHHVDDTRAGIEMCRNRRPDYVLLEVKTDINGIRLFIEEISTVSPNTQVIAIFPLGNNQNAYQDSSFVIQAMRVGVKDFLRRPISTSDLDQFIDRTLRQVSSSSEMIGKVIPFFTNKGGVGKSTLSLSTSAYLASLYPGRVLIVDASIQMGVCAPMLNLRPKTTMTDVVREKDRLDATLIRELSVEHSSGLHLLACPHNALEATLIDDEVISRVLNLARRSFDYVIVDTFPMIDKVMMAVLDQCDRAYLVSESTVPTLEGTCRMLEVLEELGFPHERKRLILNRYSSFIGNINANEVTKRMGFEINHIVPYEKKLLIAANLGEPYILNNKRSKFGKAIAAIADEIIAMPLRQALSFSNLNGTVPRESLNTSRSFKGMNND